MEIIHRQSGELITEVKFTGDGQDNINPGSGKSVFEYLISHNSQYNVLLSGIYLKPNLTSYAGTRNSYADYKEILSWGTKWSKGLTLIQEYWDSEANQLTTETTLFKNGVGSSKRNAIPLKQNGGILYSLGRYYNSGMLSYSSNQLTLSSGNTTFLNLFYSLTGSAAPCYSSQGIGILAGANDTDIALLPTVAVLNSDMEAINVGAYPVFGKIFIPQLTTSEFTTSTLINGASRYFRVLFYYNDGTGFIPFDFSTIGTQQITLKYQIRKRDLTYDTLSLKFELEVPQYVDFAYDYDIGIDINCREIK